MRYDTLDVWSTTDLTVGKGQKLISCFFLLGGQYYRYIELKGMDPSYLTTNDQKTIMNTLKEFHDTILILLTKDAFSITTDTWIDMSNRVEFIS